jgi:hypothetical protein
MTSLLKRGSVYTDHRSGFVQKRLFCRGGTTTHSKRGRSVAVAHGVV